MPAKKKAVPRVPKSFHCRLCERKIRIPQGWTRGPAVRKHYWARHPEVMRADTQETR